jgi:SiaC family regulatory phosphoprotein
MNEFQSYLIEDTPKTPQIDLNQLTGEFIFSGKSIPENAAKVYEPVFNWISQYILNARPTTNVRINFEYFNTSSSLWLAKILKVLVRINEPDYVIIIHLYLHEDEFDELEEFDDIKEAFFPIADIFQNAIPSIGVKLYGTNDSDEIIKEKLVFV